MTLGANGVGSCSNFLRGTVRDVTARGGAVHALDRHCRLAGAHSPREEGLPRPPWVLAAEEALEGRLAAAERAAVEGGGRVACELAVTRSDDEKLVKLRADPGGECGMLAALGSCLGTSE
jgi:hypothetical protein